MDWNRPELVKRNANFVPLTTFHVNDFVRP